MKKNKLIRVICFPRKGKQGYDFKDKLVNLIPIDELSVYKMKYSSPEWLTEIELLDWSELDNCNFIQKIIYKINVPKWIIKLISAVFLLAVGAYINSLFCNK